MKNLVNLLLCVGLLCCLSCNLEQVDQAKWLPEYKGIWTTAPIKIPSSSVPDGAINGNGDIGFVLGGTIDKPVYYFSKTDFWKAKHGFPEGGVCYIGELHLSIPSIKNGSFQTEQSIADGTVYSSFFKDNKEHLKIKSWCATSQNTVVIELEAVNGPVAINYNFRLAESSDSQNDSGKEKNDIQWYTRKFDSHDLAWTTGVAVAMYPQNSEISLREGERATLLLSFCTSHEKDNYKEVAVDMTSELKVSGIVDLYKKHTGWWTDFWQKSRVVLNDPELEKYYYGSNYLLACCSRNVNFPPGLWGNSLTMDATLGACWQGDYHLNYNHEAPWWGVYSSNHVELSDPYDTPILEYMPKAKKHAAELLNKKGVYYPVGIGPKGFCSSMYPLTEEKMMGLYNTPENNIDHGYMFLGQKSNAVFCTANMFMRYYHTYDKVYAQKVYPFIREVADFWEDYLVYENGRYVSYNDNFWEVGPWGGKDWKKGYGDINPTISLGLCRMLFKGIIDMSQFLNVDQEKVEKWNHILTHLSEIPRIKVDGHWRVKPCEGGNGSGGWTVPGLERISMYSLIFPAGVCGVITNPDFTESLREEVELWETEWDNLTGNETVFTSAARIGYDGNKILTHLKQRIKKAGLPNLWVAQGGGGVESLSGVPSCINEMLLQGYEGVIRVFPVWPKEKDAGFENLRTHGAFLVSSSCKSGNIEYVTVISEQGRPCKIENPWPQKGCKVIYQNGKEEKFSSEIFEISLPKNGFAKLLCLD